MAEHNDLGKKGEELAVDFLLNKGYAILQTNYMFQKAEIDIIAQIGNTLAVVEVKTRTSNAMGNPQEFVNKKKIQLLVKAINNYVIDNNLDVNVRFDIIAVLFTKNEPTIEHIEDAFYYF